MRTFFTFLTFFVFSLAAHRAFSSPSRSQEGMENPGKKKEISVGSNRKSGDMQLHFAADKAGAAVITITDESGKIVLKQTDQIKSSDNIIPLKKATGLGGGYYTVQLVSNNETYTTRFMIWK